MGLTVRQKALNYVFWKMYNVHDRKLVDVKEHDDHYIVRYEEWDDKHGVYDAVRYPKEQEGLEDAIKRIMNILQWIADGNEFPETKQKQESGSATQCIS